MGLAYELGTQPFTLTSGEDLVADRLVLISSSTAKYADGGEEPIGWTRQAVDSGDDVSITPLCGGIGRVTGSKAISAGADIYVTTDGKVSDAAVGKQIGILLTAITAAGGKGAAVLWGPRGGNDVFVASMKNLHEFKDDFDHGYDTTNVWAVVEDAGAGGGDALDDSVYGVLSVGCDGDDNDECYVSSIAENWKFQTNKKLYFETRITLTEANTDDANFIIGLSDTVAANSLQDDGAGPMASYDGAVFFKVDGTMKIQFETSNAAAQVTNATLDDFVSATTYVLGFLYDYNDGVTAKVTPYVDGVAGTTHDLTIAGLEEMHILMGVKAGGANEEALKVDYVHVMQER